MNHRLSIFALLFLFLLAPLFAQNSITVPGSADLVFPVTGVRITFTVSAEAIDIVGTQSALQQKISTALSDLKQKFGAQNDDFVQVAFSIEKNYERVNNQPVFRGYVGSAQFSYEHSALERQNEVIASLAKNGVASIDRVALISSQDKAVLATAYSDAFADASFRAKSILRQSGATVGKVLRVAEAGQAVTFSGTGFNPEGSTGFEGQTPPAYKDLSNLVGTFSTDSIRIVVTFEVKN